MKEKSEIREKLLKRCILFVENQKQTIETIIESNKKALESESKSSAGDKHETGRAMLQLEMEKASQQISSVIQMQKIVDTISLKKCTDIITLGSVVITTSNNYFISASFGEISLDKKQYFAISPKSPLGFLLLGKKKGDKTQFNGNSFTIVDVF